MQISSQYPETIEHRSFPSNQDSATPVNSDESLPRDQKSVPNFASLQKSASLEETTDAKAVLEKAKDQLETSVLTSSSSEQYGTKPQLDKDASDHLSGNLQTVRAGDTAV